MEWAIYFIGVVGKVETMAGFVAVLLGLILVLLGGIILCEANTSFSKWEDDGVKFLLRLFIRGVYVFAVSFGIFLVVPNNKTLAAMYVIPSLTQNERVQHITENSLQALEKLTQKWIQDIKSENNKNK